MKTWRVVFTMEVESHVDADTEEEAILIAREGLVGLEDGMTFVAEEATVWRDDDDQEA